MSGMEESIHLSDPTAHVTYCLYSSRAGIVLRTMGQFFVIGIRPKGIMYLPYACLKTHQTLYCHIAASFSCLTTTVGTKDGAIGNRAH